MISVVCGVLAAPLLGPVSAPESQLTVQGRVPEVGFKGQDSERGLGHSAPGLANPVRIRIPGSFQFTFSVLQREDVLLNRRVPFFPGWPAHVEQGQSCGVPVIHRLGIPIPIGS